MYLVVFVGLVSGAVTLTTVAAFATFDSGFRNEFRLHYRKGGLKVAIRGMLGPKP